jgi:hypothetical protein
VSAEPLPELLDARHLADELGITRAAAEGIMRACPIVQLPGLRKVYVRRSDVAELIARSTFGKDEVAGRGEAVSANPAATRPAV